MKLVVADSGPLIVFARSGLLGLLRQVTSEVVVPATVYAECTREFHKPGARAILQAAQSGLLAAHEDVDPVPLFGEVPTLDAGETAALALAFTLGHPVLMDERLGRSVAALHRIAVVGSAGILLAAKERGLVERIAPILASWQSMGYFLSPGLMAGVLTRAGERPEDQA